MERTARLSIIAVGLGALGLLTFTPATAFA